MSLNVGAKPWLPTTIVDTNFMASPSPSQPFGYAQPGNSTLSMGASGLQQSLRNIGGNIGVQQFPGRLNAGGSHLPGHVTPTSSGIPNFPTSLPNNLPSQQASPNSLLSRGLSSRGLNQEMKRLIGIGMPVGGGNNSLGMSGFGLSHSRGGLPHGLMGTALDLSEFPVLTNRGQEGLGSNLPSNPMAGRPPYVGMVKQPTSESNEFQIHNEDFPALPGSQTQEINQDLNKSSLNDSKDSLRFHGEKSQNQKRGIQTTKDGRVMNIPSGMVTDQFGMVGLLTFIRVAETDPNLVSLALGNDLTTLGLNLNSPENLYPNFAGPWSDHPCRPQDIDYLIPQEYIMNPVNREKLASVKLNRYGEDLLFFLFYMYGGDVLQIMSAAELHNRDWRFHKDDRVWITRAPGMVPTEKTTTYERGTYYFFDAVNWRKVAKEFHLDYDRLEDRPQYQNLSAYNAAAQSMMF